MESLQNIKNRIESVGSTRQITQSMRLVATAKVQTARARMEANQPFHLEAQSLLRSVSALHFDSRHPYLHAREKVACAAVVMISGDRGLCGGYNHNVGRKTEQLLRTLDDVKLMTIGAKARDYCRRRWKSKLAHVVTDMSETPYFDDAKELTELLLTWFRGGEVDEVYLVHTRFINMLTQEPHVQRLLPLDPSPVQDGETSFVRSEPGGDNFIQRLVPFYLTTTLYGAILESAVCEQSARITSMDAAAKNANDMIETLSLTYNQVRQSVITQEINEIVGGANAVQR